jgi:myosin heavy subunit
MTLTHNHQIPLQIADVDSSKLFPFASMISSMQIFNVNSKTNVNLKLESGSSSETHKIHKRSDASSELQQSRLKIESLEKELEKATARINSIYEQIDKREEEFTKRQKEFVEKIENMKAKENTTQELHQLRLQICHERSSESQLKVSKLEGELQEAKLAMKNCEERSTGSSSKSDELERTLSRCRQDIDTSTAKLSTANEKISTLQSEMTTAQQNQTSALKACQDQIFSQSLNVLSLEDTIKLISDKNTQLENVCSKKSILNRYSAFFNRPGTPKNCPTVYTSKLIEKSSEALISMAFTLSHFSPTAPSICSNEIDITDSNGKYVKTACLAYKQVHNYDRAERTCQSHGMPLLQFNNEKELSIVAEFANRKWTSVGHLWIDGRNGNNCGILHRSNQISEFMPQMDKCSRTYHYFCEFKSK